jgi:hypothetical protein
MAKRLEFELPQTVVLTVLETEPGLKSATASSVTKAGEDRDGPCCTGASVYQRRRKDQG